jgi:hypothetical protein
MEVTPHFESGEETPSFWVESFYMKDFCITLALVRDRSPEIKFKLH